MKSILLVRLGGLGDLLAVLPSIRFVRSLYPGVRLTLVGRPEYGILYRTTGWVDALEPGSGARFARIFSEDALAAEEGRIWLAGFDFVLGWMQPESGAGFRESLGRLGVEGKILTGDPRSGLTVSRHFFDLTARSLEAGGTGLPSYEDCLALPLGVCQRRAGRVLAVRAGIGPGCRYAVIHPGAGSPAKRWPLGNFLEAARFLAERGLGGLVVTGEAEAALEIGLRAADLPPSWQRLSRPGLIDLAGLLAECSLYLGNDSGITHLAAACGAPVLAVFRADFATAWSPVGRSLVFSAPEVSSIDPGAVTAAAARILSGR
jgi:heptosyltransferase-3